MKTGDDFRREFPAVEEQFREAIERGLYASPEKTLGRNHHLRIAALMTAVMLLLTSAAVAATISRWSVQDFTAQSGKANLSEEAIKALAAGFEDHVIDNPYASLVVTEAVYDGMATYILIEATPKLDGAFIIPTYLHKDNQAYSFGRGYPKDVSLQQYAEHLGYEFILSMACFASETTGHFYDSAINEDGSFSLMLWSFVRPEYRNLPELTLNMHINVSKNEQRVDEVRSTFRIPLAEEVQFARSVQGEAVTFENAGVHIKGVEVVRTPMSTYIIANYDIVNRVNYNQYIIYRQFRFLDENGATLQKGAHPLSIRIDDRMSGLLGNQPCYLTNRLFDEMPTQITIGEYDGNRTDGWTEGKTYTFHLE